MNDTDTLMPDPSRGSVKKKEQLLELATTHKVLRMSAENGMIVDDAIRIIAAYADRMNEAAFPVSQYHLLK